MGAKQTDIMLEVEVRTGHIPVWTIPGPPARPTAQLVLVAKASPKFLLHIQIQIHLALTFLPLQLPPLQPLRMMFLHMLIIFLLPRIHRQRPHQCQNPRFEPKLLHLKMRILFLVLLALLAFFGVGASWTRVRDWECAQDLFDYHFERGVEVGNGCECVE